MLMLEYYSYEKIEWFNSSSDNIITIDQNIMVFL